VESPVTELDAHHTGITVSDLDRAVAFYRDVLGLDLLDRFTVSGEAFATAVGVDGATGSFAHLDAGGIRVELVEYDPDGESLPAGRINRPGTAHLGFAVDDLDAFAAALPDDVATLSDPRTTASGTRILFARDPEGNLVEVLES
jgi:catechol 2,3-dioxygenase-like lactoylglutathione lyase family enzyme